MIKSRMRCIKHAAQTGDRGIYPWLALHIKIKDEMCAACSTNGRYPCP